MTAANSSSKTTNHERQGNQHDKREEEKGRRKRKKGEKEDEVNRKRKGREERESARKGERGKEKGRNAEEEECKQVEKDAMDWTVVTRNKRQNKMAQIFVKVNGSKATPMEVNLDGWQSRRLDESDPEKRGRVCDNVWESAEKKREAEELRSQ